MTTGFEIYQPRKIAFCRRATVDGWQIKIYSITNRPSFSSQQVLENAVAALPGWLPAGSGSALPNYRIAFLIVHEGREGVWLLLSWWTGGEMVETVIHFAGYATPDLLQPSPYHSHSLLCVWELEVFMHERQAWIHHVLLQADQPDFAGYLNDTAGGRK